MAERRSSALRTERAERPTRPDVPTASGEYRRTYATVEMPAVRMLDEELGFDAADDDLDIPLLDETPRPARHEPPPPSAMDSSAVRRKSPTSMPAVRRTSGAMNAVQPPARRSSGAMPAVRASSGSMNAVDPRAVYAAFAKFGDPPATIWSSPAYAVHVWRRKRTLERELEVARRRGLARRRALRGRAPHRRHRLRPRGDRADLRGGLADDAARCRGLPGGPRSAPALTC